MLSRLCNQPQEKEDELFKFPFGNDDDAFDPHLYVVSAERAMKPSLAAGNDVISIIRSEMWEANHMDSGDRMLCAARLNTLHEEGVEGVMEGAKYVDSLYEILNVMRQVSPPPISSLLSLFPSLPVSCLGELTPSHRPLGKHRS